MSGAGGAERNSKEIYKALRMSYSSLMKQYDAPRWWEVMPKDPREWVTRGQSDEVRAAVAAADTRKGYLAWDQFRHRSAPLGWTPEALWGLVKLRRIVTPRALPELLGKDGAPFHVVNSDPLLAALQRIDTRAALWRAPGPEEAGADRDASYRFRAAIEEAFHSSAIEGAVTTRRVAKEMIESGRSPRTNSERMIVNNFRTIERLTDWAGEPLTPSLICAIQSSITEDTLDDPADSGRFRTGDDVIIRDAATLETVFVPPPALELPRRMQQLCTFANADDGPDEFLHPVVRSIAVHHQLAYDHPFADGNGRTARALFMWSILRRGYWWFRSMSVSRAIDKSRASYYDAYRYVQGDEGDVTYFVRQQVRCIEQEIDRLAEHLARLAEIADRAKRRSKVAANLNSRQLALLGHALNHDDAAYTFEGHRAHHAVTYPTAFQDLTAMEKAGLLSRRTERRKAVFTPTAKLRALGKA